MDSKLESCGCQRCGMTLCTAVRSVARSSLSGEQSDTIYSNYNEPYVYFPRVSHTGLQRDVFKDVHYGAVCNDRKLVAI